MIASNIRAHIVSRLDEVERAEGVRILFAAESGSRAWGFPSPDSDYDVRFVYAHDLAWYLSLREERDVIERPLDDHAVDLAGWDARKALRLLLKSNAALYEWCCSPIIYREAGEARQIIKALFETAAGTQALAYHYRETARTHWRRNLEGREAVKLKRYFYVVRPLLALDWVARRGTAAPMQIGDLLAAGTMPAEAADAFQTLLALKRETPEIGRGPRIPALDAWIVPRLAADLVTPPGNAAPDRGDAARLAADAAFRQLVGYDATEP